jgi:hypothetical protein
MNTTPRTRTNAVKSALRGTQFQGSGVTTRRFGQTLIFAKETDLLRDLLATRFPYADISTYGTGFVCLAW